ncbi:hypothetical protein NGM10_08290 [Halorussus salilacus]|uniref:hypothetical protein n=1 Tax=Halorussus salilacus TaxID=2953750 RepID=UPI00209DB9AB|nr:hypothetical protein [Halorussus salilacus]USZ66740.1 hypothetical protein NGM10_08290 [Halorussus salilacus]
MSQDIRSSTRRTVLKKAGVTVALFTGATSSVTAQAETQDSKEHYLRFEIDNGDGTGEYSGELPDPNPDTENLESGEDEVTTYDDHSHYSGEVDGSWQPRYDEYRFDGSLDSPDFSWDADSNVRVILDGTVVQG